MMQLFILAQNTETNILHNSNEFLKHTHEHPLSLQVLENGISFHLHLHNLFKFAGADTFT